MTSWWPVVAIVAVVVATVGIGLFGVRVSRTTSDFLVASRSVSPMLNASAIGGEYLSAASFLGIAGLVLTYGVDMLWFPVGYTVGYLVLLVLVAAPLRRSGAYTLPDFAEMRTRSQKVRLTSSALVVLIGWLYLLPQLQGAGITLQALTGAPQWAGSLVVAVVVGITVATGGMRSITVVQAFQYWLKLVAIALPAVLLVAAWYGDGAPVFTDGGWGEPLSGYGGREYPLYSTYSILLATFLGTMGLPHVLVRFYTNPDGRAARRTTLAVLGLLSVFYVFPPVLGALGRVYTPELAGTPTRPTPSCSCSPPGCSTGGSGRRCRPSSPPVRSRRSCPPPAACRCRSPACCRRTSCATTAAWATAYAASASARSSPWSCRSCWRWSPDAPTSRRP